MVYNAPTHAMQILKPAMKKITTIYPANPQYKKMILKHPESKLLSYSSPTQIAKFFPVHPDSFSSSDPSSSSGTGQCFELALGRKRVTSKDIDVLLTVTYSSSAITARPTIYTSI